MLLLNFTHPLTPDHLQQLQALTGQPPHGGQPVEQVVEINSQVDPQQPLAPQVAALADRAGLSPAEWQTQPILVVPPSLNFITAALLAELHGRMGYFPPIVRLRPVPGSTPTHYEVAEVINLQQVRDDARTRRHDEPPQ